MEHSSHISSGYRGRRKAVFLDRDGVLNEDRHYIRSPGELVLLPGVAGAMKQLKAAGYLLVVVTNQSGIARGYFTEKDLELIHRHMVEMLGKEGAEPDDILYCPHHPDAGVVKDPAYLKDCSCRKPKPGMILSSAGKMSIDTSKSWMVGDALRDIEAGKSAGCRTILIGEDPDPGNESDYVARNLREASDIILKS